MFGWTEMATKVTAQPTPPAQAPPMPIETPTLAQDPNLMAKVDRAIDALFGGKKKKIPQPHSCGACGGVVWA